MRCRTSRPKDKTILQREETRRGQKEKQLDNARGAGKRDLESMRDSRFGEARARVWRRPLRESRTLKSCAACAVARRQRGSSPGKSAKMARCFAHARTGAVELTKARARA
eukprot:6187197-Pleurochrysis_carterae.AAC.2